MHPIPPDLGLLDRMVSRTPGGRHRLPVPWDALNEIERLALPIFLRRIGRAVVPLALGAVLTLTFGAVSGRPAPIAASIGVLLVLVGAYVQAWRRTAIGIEIVGSTQRVAERGRVELTIRISHEESGASSAHSGATCAMIYGVFEGAVEREIFVLVEKSALDYGKPASLVWSADRGMGQHALRDLRLVVWDDLGLFPMCVSFAEDLVVIVEPEYQELRDFELRGTSLSLEEGALDSLRPGESPAFRGIRPWRTGDSMRRVDWRRSLRANELVIREFDRMGSTEAVFCFDQSVGGHSSFGDLSSFETLKDASLALARWFLAHRAPVTFLADGVTTPSCSGRIGDEMLADVVRDLPPTLTSMLPQIVASLLLTTKPHTVVVIFGATFGLGLEEMWESLLTLDAMQVEVIFVLTDSAQFLAAVKSTLNVGAEAADAVKQLAAQSQDEHQGTLSRLADKLLGRALVLAPRESLATLLDTKGGVA